MLVKFELLIVYNVNTLNFIWLIKGFVYTSFVVMEHISYCLLYTSPSPRDRTRSRMPSSA